MDRKSHPPLNVIGLMSGTSIDSVDAACIRVAMETEPLRLSRYKLLGTTTLDFPPALRETVLRLISDPMVRLKAICQLHSDLGYLFAQAANALIGQLAEKGISVDLIASHGQTLYHIPPHGEQPGSSLQLGQPAIIAEQTGIETVADFRPADMAAGGHGAPLVPFADLLLFQGTTVARAVQNIGGIANLTAIPPRNQPGKSTIAFDTGPGNMVIDGIMQAVFNSPYDENGRTARRGRVHPGMINQMLSDPYFAAPPPKSTGREQFGQTYVNALIEAWQDHMPPEDLVTTATALTVETIALGYERFVLPKLPVKEVIVCGGGTMNAYLMELLSERLSRHGVALRTMEDFGVPSKYKEAIAFALLGYARKMHIPGNLPSSTGAKRPAILGAICAPPPKPPEQ